MTSGHLACVHLNVQFFWLQPAFFSVSEVGVIFLVRKKIIFFMDLK